MRILLRGDPDVAGLVSARATRPERSGAARIPQRTHLPLHRICADRPGGARRCQAAAAGTEGNMKWCRYSVRGETSFGLIEGDSVRKVAGTPWGEHKIAADSVPLANVKLELPVIPSTFFCVGVNYRDHVDRMAANPETTPSPPPPPDIGFRANNALIAHEENIVKPRDAGEQFQYEGELGAAVGKRCRNVSKDDALASVFGWTSGNDVSERTGRANARTLWRAKNCDPFKPMGPWIVTGA